MSKIVFMLCLNAIVCCAVACGSNVSEKVPALAPKAEVEKRSVGKFMESLNELAIDERIARYRALKRDQPNAYNFDEEKELNQYGYSLLFSNKRVEAIKIFTLLVSEFPDNANPYDSLAEAYKQGGDTEKAIANYEKSLRLDPGNSRVKFEIEVLTGALDILDTDWGKEIFQIPLPFAKSMTIVGHEDARFTKGWGSKDSDEFWTYAFAWKIEHEGRVRKELLQENLSLYFEGLMSETKGDLDSTAVTTFNVTGETPKKTSFEGTSSFMDTRLTKARLTLNVKVESRQCAEQGKAVVVFWFSPKAFDHAIWTKLREVQMLSDICSR